jgi:hypothetical protein
LILKLFAAVHESALGTAEVGVFARECPLPEHSRVAHHRPFLPQSSNASRRAARLSGFFALSQCGERPDCPAPPERQNGSYSGTMESDAGAPAEPTISVR